MSSIFWKSFCATSLLFMGSAASVAQEPFALRQAIDMALGKNPQVALAHANAKDANAAFDLARTQYLPQLSFTEDISRGNDPVYVFGSRLRQRQFTLADFALNALNRPLPLNNLSTRFSGQWIAFDSFKTQREVRGAGYYKQSAASASQAVDQQVVLGVVSAYQQVLYANRALAVAQNEQDTAAALLASVEDRVQAGLAVESDRMSAQVNAAARKQDLIAAQGDVEIAWADLRAAIGNPELQATALKPIELHTFPDSELDAELAQALKTRPDLLAMSLASQAQSQTVSAVRSGFGPRVSAYGNWEENRSAISSPGGNSWVAGVQISVDILPFGKRAQLVRAGAGKARAEAQAAIQQQQARVQVSRAHIHRQTAVLQLETAHAAMKQADESLRILKNRYDAGLANMTDVLRAEDASRQSQSNYWHAVYGNAMSYAELLYSQGILTPDAAEDLQ
jgi:outer membrane protein